MFLLPLAIGILLPNDVNESVRGTSTKGELYSKYSRFSDTPTILLVLLFYRVKKVPDWIS